VVIKKISTPNHQDFQTTSALDQPQQSNHLLFQRLCISAVRNTAALHPYRFSSVRSYKLSSLQFLCASQARLSERDPCYSAHCLPTRVRRENLLQQCLLKLFRALTTFTSITILTRNPSPDLNETLTRRSLNVNRLPSLLVVSGHCGELRACKKGIPYGVEPEHQGQ
jgi:hypothetical protein